MPQCVFPSPEISQDDFQELEKYVSGLFWLLYNLIIGYNPCMRYWRSASPLTPTWRIITSPYTGLWAKFSPHISEAPIITSTLPKMVVIVHMPFVTFLIYHTFLKIHIQREDLPLTFLRKGRSTVLRSWQSRGPSGRECMYSMWPEEDPDKKPGHQGAVLEGQGFTL